MPRRASYGYRFSSVDPGFRRTVRPAPGIYEIAADLYSESWSRHSSRTTVLATVIEGYGTAEERSSEHVFTFRDEGDGTVLGRVEVSQPPARVWWPSGPAGRPR